MFVGAHLEGHFSFFFMLDEVSTPHLSTSDTLPFGLRMVRGVSCDVLYWYHFLYPEVYVHLSLFSYFFCNNMYDAYIT